MGDYGGKNLNLQKSIPITIYSTFKNLAFQQRCLTIDSCVPKRLYVVSIPESLVSNKLNYYYNINGKITDGWSAALMEINFNGVNLASSFSLILKEDTSTFNKNRVDSIDFNILPEK